MRMRRRAFVAGALLSAVAGRAQAERYPDKPIRLVVPFPPGGPTDLIARVVAVGMAADLGQQVIIDNKAGAGGNVGTDMVAKSKPDGYTLLFGTAATHGINVSLYKNLPYDPVKDFELVSLVGLAPMALLVPPGQPSTLKELIAKLRAEPGKWSYPSSGNGTTNHLAGELFKKRTGVDVLHVPYRGTGPALQDLLAGRHAFIFATLGPVMENIRAGQLVPVALMADKRSGVMPDIPTTAEAGLPDFVGGTWNVVAAPAGTARTIVDRLNASVNKALVDPVLSERLKALNMETSDAPSPASTKAFVEAEIVKWRDVVEIAGANVD
ncbi:MAG: tripartite tricarboxylate transporter substrate binding protein [Reyranella sp.]|uniref:Bug family tripartite tricarboxylate transporter substrate binding protein n=1 Tax=Reyranella sp. TaxID=1929291 RepID=UPI0025F5DEE5|nr:tripartite tricarboxylate transporter substrate binding protein [Reyranella sp.]MBR2818446.1 tripartite tricarboxylate transporter substrate binding protein [Reyranella sp.]